MAMNMTNPIVRIQPAMPIGADGEALGLTAGQIVRGTVMWTAPGRRAVALRYQPAVMASPQVVATGRGAVAERMIALPREHDTPIWSDCWRRSTSAATFRPSVIRGGRGTGRRLPAQRPGWPPTRHDPLTGRPSGTGDAPADWL